MVACQSVSENGCLSKSFGLKSCQIFLEFRTLFFLFPFLSFCREGKSFLDFYCLHCPTHPVALLSITLSLYRNIFFNPSLYKTFSKQFQPPSHFFTFCLLKELLRSISLIFYTTPMERSFRRAFSLLP